ncbi:hypothetical protein BZA05DRAFT_411227 [Tricharina praecox]|uniref:uncharacterized protein n=1 Tax=Tricharina praecox TaxID=43433 RepID=UPI002220B962|nr:uncharacterized protein BZA05DRAFT_411227 [Tricharina praecox]KAI5843144.1 hypothetical protein BZA05DRAFT_411227 [Tricharina praecox]
MYVCFFCLCLIIALLHFFFRHVINTSLPRISAIPLVSTVLYRDRRGAHKVEPYRTVLYSCVGTWRKIRILILHTQHHIIRFGTPF